MTNKNYLQTDELIDTIMEFNERVENDAEINRLLEQMIARYEKIKNDCGAREVIEDHEDMMEGIDESMAEFVVCDPRNVTLSTYLWFKA